MTSTHSADTVWRRFKRSGRHDGPSSYDVCMSDRWNHSNRTCRAGCEFCAEGGWSQLDWWDRRVQIDGPVCSNRSPQR